MFARQKTGESCGLESLSFSVGMQQDRESMERWTGQEGRSASGLPSRPDYCSEALTVKPYHQNHRLPGTLPYLTLPLWITAMPIL